MKTVLKYLTVTALALTALTCPSLQVNATEVEEEREAREDIGAREAYHRLQLQDENGQIPPDAWTNAYAEKEAMRFLPEAWSEFSSDAQLDAGIAGGIWTSIGPGNVGGRIRSIIIHLPPLLGLSGLAEFLAVFGRAPMVVTHGRQTPIAWPIWL